MVQITTIIPVFNSQDHIANAIENVLEQTYRSHEIIVVNDGSSDNTVEIAQQYSRYVKIINQPNQGVSAACNAGIDVVSSEWVAFLDCDDKWQKNKLELQAEVISSMPSLNWVGCNGYNYDYVNQKKLPLVQQEMFSTMLSGKMYVDDFLKVAHMGLFWLRSSNIIKKSALISVGCFDRNISSGEDLDLALRLGYRYPKFGYVNEHLTFYSTRKPYTLSDRRITDRLKSLKKLTNKHLKLSQKMNYRNEIKQVFAPRIQRWVGQTIDDGNILTGIWLMIRYSTLLSAKTKYNILKRMLLR